MIEIINLCKSFGPRRVFHNLNLTIETGETLVIIGRSGAGKSVLLKHIVGLIRPDSGQVIIDGVDVCSIKEITALDKIRMKFGMLFQGAALFDSLSIWENVGFALIQHTSMGEEEIRRRVRECLALVGLEGIEEMKPAELSGGMRKRVGLARAICMNPETLFYDEPTTGIDPIMADAITDLIIDLHDKLRVTSIVVTHDIISAYKVASRIAMLYAGKIIEIGTTDQIRNTKNLIVQQFITGAATGPITEAEGLAI